MDRYAIEKLPKYTRNDKNVKRSWDLDKWIRKIILTEDS